MLRLMLEAGIVFDSNQGISFVGNLPIASAILSSPAYIVHDVPIEDNSTAVIMTWELYFTDSRVFGACVSSLLG
jgi:hypothetical protein